jgi:hypothetical protein
MNPNTDINEKSNKYLLFAILGNVLFFYVSYLDYGFIRVTFIHIIFGIVPLLIAIYRRFSKKPKIT